MIELYKKNINIDSVTLIEQLQKNNKLEKVGGIAYITNLCNYVPSAKNCINYAKIVKEKSIQRKLFNAGFNDIVWCETAGKAKYEIACMEGIPFTDTKVHRVKWADNFGCTEKHKNKRLFCTWLGLYLQ